MRLDLKVLNKVFFSVVCKKVLFFIPLLPVGDLKSIHNISSSLLENNSIQLKIVQVYILTGIICVCNHTLAIQRDILMTAKKYRFLSSLEKERTEKTRRKPYIVKIKVKSAKSSLYKKIHSVCTTRHLLVVEYHARI